MRTLRLAVAVLAGALGCGRSGAPASGDAPEPPEAQTSELETALVAAGVKATTLDAASGDTDAPEAYALVEATTDAGTFHLQWADLRQVELAQMLGDTVRAPEAEGAFYPDSPSPAFAMLAADSVVARGGDGLLAVMNGAFFETPMRPSTRLAFPVASGGTVVTGGSSPNGPGRPGARGRRWDQPLRALALGTPEARIAAYDHASGTASGDPLGSSLWRDALVSYAPEAHPTRFATRFHVLGALDRDGDGTAETVVAVTNDGASTIVQTNAVLGALGVAPEARLATDGGASVFVWNRASGVLHRPTRNQPLPHYLTLRLR